MDTKFNYDTPQIALEKLHHEGYSVDFNLHFDYLLENADFYNIDYLYRYEGASDPADESSVYGISNSQTGVKGVFVAGNLSFLEGKKRDIILALELKSKGQQH